MSRRIFSRRQNTETLSAGLILLYCSVFALGLAWLTENILQIVPCELCLVERWPWRVAAVAGLLALLFRGHAGRGMIMIGVLAMIPAMGLAILHTGVEAGFWPSPFPSCRAPVLPSGNMADFIHHLPSHPSKPCDAPTYLIDGLPVSMTAMGGIAAALTAGLTVMAAGFFRPHGRSA
ncbi:disulfide bond formation protein B [Acetobacter sp. AN02]|uniref:disulfide bond formation protein B n=1 Tax=Acetobacter sp. AN02 TaxID=2894186 RepID=UPI002434384E|nr:disulfide bond formation protein B [Acetobacter sp. AN02]MDG6094840.1 disulfide bond formation protein B [Acetobacter sp. AN02]